MVEFLFVFALRHDCLVVALPKTRGELDLKPGYKNLRVLAAFDLGTVGSLKKQLDCFLQILAGSFDRIALACDINLGAQADVAFTFPLHNGSEFLYVLHRTPY